MNTSSIMRFEDLLELWQGQRSQQSLSEFLSIRSRGDVRGGEEDDPGLMRVLRERLGGTWWEVTWSRQPVWRSADVSVRCRYLADSLTDAIRRCPGVQLPLELSIDDADDATAEDDLDAPAIKTLPLRRRARSPAGRRSP